MKAKRAFVSLMLALGFLFILLAGVARAAPGAADEIRPAQAPDVEMRGAANEDHGSASAIAATGMAPLNPAAGAFGKTAPASAHPGEVITYELVIQNTNPDACIATIQDPTPEGVVYAWHLPPLEYSADPPGVFGDVTVGVGETITLTWGVSVTGDVGSTIVNTATIMSDQPFFPITATAETVIVAPKADITATKMAPIDIFPGDTITYDIVIQNTGDVSGEVEFMQDLVPNGAVYAWHESPLNYTDDPPASVFWSGSVEPGENLTLTWGVSASGDIDDVILNQAVFGGDEPFTATAVTRIVAPLEPTITATKTAPAWAYAGENITYALNIISTGSVTTTACLTDPIPSTLDLDLGSLWANSGVIEFNPGTDAIEWCGPVQPYDEVQISFEATVNRWAAAGQPIMNEALLVDEDAGVEHELAATTIVSSPFTGYDQAGGLAIDSCRPWECAWYECADPCEEALCPCDEVQACPLDELQGYQFTDDPVNLINGNLVYQVGDVRIRRGMLPLRFQRTYNSLSLVPGPLGYGWTHPYNTWLSIAPPDAPHVYLYAHDGAVLQFDRNPVGSYSPPAGIHRPLT